ncbi:MAG: hypothetical protein KDC05_09130, partial [Bacteroidales bacterium]|nr:hypothetical protein [Bacteroidales bacterium]
MKKIYLATGISFVLLLLNPLFGQQNQPTELTSDEINAYKEKVKGLVNYVESTLNFIGDPETVPREKEIAISESYLKVFKDDKVQIEDDLDDNRDVPLHKDVQAYLKDIRFFFRQAEFTFNIEKVDHFVNNQNNHFFKVTYNRQLKAITVSGDTIDSRKTRYMEVNLDPNKNDLKIASIYTTKLNEKEEIITWWNGLNSTWRNIFGKGRMVWDTLELSRIESLKDSLVYLTPNAPAKPDSSGYEVSFPIERIQLSALGPDSVIADIREIINRIRSVMKQKT